MAATIISRGPDDVGYWCDAVGDGTIGLALRRLPILNLSPAGYYLPMTRYTGRYVLTGRMRSTRRDHQKPSCACKAGKCEEKWSE